LVLGPKEILRKSNKRRARSVRVWFLEEKMSGKGAKGLLTSKTPAQSKEKDKKKPTSRSSRAGLQVFFLLLFIFLVLLMGFLSS
jgi:hypothetical protein